MAEKKVNDVKVVIIDCSASLKEDLNLFVNAEQHKGLREYQKQKLEDNGDFDANEESQHPQSGSTYISLDYKKKVVALADAHPNWNLQTLQQRGAQRLKSWRNIALWKKEIEMGGTKTDKMRAINKETLDRFREARRSGQPVVTRTLQKWAMEAAAPLLSETFKFQASSRWVDHFKYKHKIRQRRVITHNIEMMTLEETVQSEETQPKESVPTFDPFNLLSIPKS